jgi:peptidoglycan/xylan/chitin deacetylase (PgdA/CDA1 family)
MKRIMTVDLEPDVDGRFRSLTESVPKLLNYFDDQKIKATFFTVSSLLEKHENLIKEISKKHEIASHSHTHSILNPANTSWEIRHSKEVFKRYGIDVKGFRAPKFITTKNHFKLLKEHGYSYDSSLARYFPGRYANWSMKGKPFVKDGMVEFPSSNFLWPAVDAGLPYLKLLHPVSKVFPKPYMFYLHPWEFLEGIEDKRFVGKLLQRNAGRKAIEIFRNYVEGEKWIGCADWMKANKKKIIPMKE